MSARNFLTSPEMAPLDLVLSLIPSLPRALLSRLVERAIECLDDMDGDPDIEDDDPAGQADEDGINTGIPIVVEHGQSLYGPGCPWSDPGELGCRTMLRPTYDGEDQTSIVLPAPAGIEPYRFSVS